MSASEIHMTIGHDMIQSVSLEAVDISGYPPDGILKPAPATLRLWREKQTQCYRIELQVSDSFFSYTVNPIDVRLGDGFVACQSRPLKDHLVGGLAPHPNERGWPRQSPAGT